MSIEHIPVIFVDIPSIAHWLVVLNHLEKYESQWEG